MCTDVGNEAKQQLFDWSFQRSILLPRVSTELLAFQFAQLIGLAMGFFNFNNFVVAILVLACQTALVVSYCRFSDGTIAHTGCGGCVLEDPRLLSVCSLSGRWMRKRCNPGLRCVFRGGSCSAHCDFGSTTHVNRVNRVDVINVVSTRNLDSARPSGGGRDCQFGNGKSAAPGCSGCVATDPHMISICESTGRWMKKRCENGGRCVFAGTSCSARCIQATEEGQKCRFSDGKTANPGCSGCVHGNASLLSTCQTSGQWLKTKCAEGTKCVFKQGSCTAKCDYANSTDTTLPPTTCKFANGKTANPGCSGCVRGDPKMISICQPNGQWLKSRCNSTFDCDFAGGSCSATCKLPTAANPSSTTVATTTTTATTTTQADILATTTTLDNTPTTPYYTDESESDSEVNVIDNDAIHT